MLSISTVFLLYSKFLIISFVSFQVVTTLPKIHYQSVKLLGFRNLVGFVGLVAVVLTVLAPWVETLRSLDVTTVLLSQPVNILLLVSLFCRRGLVLVLVLPAWILSNVKFLPQAEILHHTQLLYRECPLVICVCVINYKQTLRFSF